jgi:hypothetical protein
MGKGEETSPLEECNTTKSCMLCLGRMNRSKKNKIY